MARYISLTAIGKDRYGIVSSITKVLYEAKCNIEDSTMTILHGQFAMILILRLPIALCLEVLYSKLQKVSKSLGMSLSYTQLSAYAPKKHKSFNPYIISVYGCDKMGIAYNVSEYLAKNKINITDVQTVLSKRNGKDTYIMIIECEIPKGKSYDKVSKDLKEMSNLININISLNKTDSAHI